MFEPEGVDDKEKVGGGVMATLIVKKTLLSWMRCCERRIDFRGRDEGGEIFFLNGGPSHPFIS
jgi:hypothetical protein